MTDAERIEQLEAENAALRGTIMHIVTIVDVLGEQIASEVAATNGMEMVG